MKDVDTKNQSSIEAALASFIPASVRICDELGASGHIPVKHLADSNGSRYKALS
jgi:hypothetical protein